MSHRLILHRTRSEPEVVAIATYMNKTFPAYGFSHAEDGFCKFVFCDGDVVTGEVELYYLMKVVQAYLDGYSDGKFK